MHRAVKHTAPIWIGTQHTHKKKKIHAHCRRAHTHKHTHTHTHTERERDTDTHRSAESAQHYTMCILTSVRSPLNNILILSLQFSAPTLPLPAWREEMAEGSTLHLKTNR